jgi:serine protease Do
MMFLRVRQNLIILTTLISLGAVGLVISNSFLESDASASNATAVAATSASAPSSAVASAASSLSATDKSVLDTKTTAPLKVSSLGEPLPRNLFIELGKLINPAVVSITTSQNIRQHSGRYRDPLQEFLEEFYGGRGPGMDGPGMGGPAPAPRSEQIQALGTGFIIREDGLIITNNHVVEQADVIKVQLDETSNKFYEAKVIGRDSRTDIALIKIEAKKPLPVAPLGSSKDVQVGEWVAAFGNPYGHAHTMTKGIVSAIGREIAEINRFPFIQTDASINPGNSGGPLVNSNGFVIGVNTAIDARAQGIGFAIPIDNVKQIINVLEKGGKIQRGFIGVGIATVNDEIADSLGLKEAKGVLITQIMRDGPADKAGIRPYDIITEFGTRQTANATDLQNAVADAEIGSHNKLKVLRFDDAGKKKELALNITITESPDDRRDAGKGSKDQKRQYFGQKAPFDLGFMIADYSLPLAKEYGFDPNGPHAPVITEVTPQSPAASSGLRPGDLVLDVNRQNVTKATDVLKFLKAGRNNVRIARGQMVAIVPLGK